MVKKLFILTLALVSILVVSACAPSTDAEIITVTPPTVTVTSSSLDADAVTITMEEIGHWHTLAAKVVEFTVTDTATGNGLSGLNPVVEIHQAGTTRVSTRTMENEQIVEVGGGVYSVEYTPSSLGSYGMVVRVIKDGQEFVSQPVAFETSRGGEEGIRVDIGGSSYIYQIRFNWDPGHPHTSADAEDKVTLVFEIMRGIEEGADINWEQPWQNLQNYITDAEHAEVRIESEDGTVSDEIHPIYKGKGIYEVERAFLEAEVGHDGMDYHVTFVFTDPYNGAEVQNSEHFELHVSAPH